jgi:hypothetical protein
VGTALDTRFRDQVNDDQCMEPMPLDKYMDKTMATLQGADAKGLKEVATEFASMGMST